MRADHTEVGQHVQHVFHGLGSIPVEVTEASAIGSDATCVVDAAVEMGLCQIHRLRSAHDAHLSASDVVRNRVDSAVDTRQAALIRSIIIRGPL